jgi:hypothetical protein
VEATARPAARERGRGCGQPAALSFTALVGTGFKPVPTSVFLRQGAVATIHELLANIGFNPVPTSVFLRQTWRPPQGPQRGSGAGGEGRPQRGSGAGGEGAPQLCLSSRWLVGTGFNPVPPSVFLRQTWRPPQGPQRGSGAGGAGDPQLCLSPRW